MKHRFLKVFLITGFFTFNQFKPEISAESAEIISIKTENLPEIEKLSSRDIIFKQLCDLVEENDRNFQNNIEQNCEFYLYTVKKSEDLFTVSAATGIPYDTIASLNRIQSVSDKIYGKKIIIPSVKGIYVNKNPVSPVEIMIYEDFTNLLDNNKNQCYHFNDSEFMFIPGSRLTATSRAFFLDSTIRLPLDNIKITSGFGMRISPVSKDWKFHKGVDFACQEGTAVHACKNGTVEFIQFNHSIFGNYMILRHAGGMTSVYAHLSKINVSKGDSVSTGKIIGYSGKTGAVTGPHLHFEIRNGGKAENPMDFIK